MEEMNKLLAKRLVIVIVTSSTSFFLPTISKRLEGWEGVGPLQAKSPSETTLDIRLTKFSKQKTISLIMTTNVVSGRR